MEKATETKRSSKQLDFILHSKEYGIVVGASNLLNSGNWSGEIYYFEKENAIPYKQDIVTASNCVRHTLPISISCGSFLKNGRKIIVGNDYGTLATYTIADGESTIYDISSTTGILSMYNEVCNMAHDRSILGVSVSGDGKKAVSGGMDFSINLWDLEAFAVNLTYNNAHSHYITSVRYKGSNPDTAEQDKYIVSTSLDGYCLLWDQRLPNPALVLSRHENAGYTTVDWLGNCENKLFVGCDNGELAIVDVRYTKESQGNTQKTKVASGYVNKISAYNRNNEKFIAVCEDSFTLKVYKYEDENLLNEIYKDTTHRDYIKDAVWINSEGKPQLLSCSWDSMIVKHNPLPSSAGHTD